MAALVFLLTFAENILLFQPAFLPLYDAVTTQLVAFQDQFLYPSSQFDPAGLRNAVWLEHKWFQNGWKDEDVVRMARRLKENRIVYVYPHLGPSGQSGELPSFSVQAAQRFQRILRHEYPGIQILPWIGGVQSGYKQTGHGTIDLTSTSYRNAFARQCTRLTSELGFEGIHLNIEPVTSGDPRLIVWLQEIKSAIGKHKVLSVAASKPAFLEGLNLSPLRSWDLSYFEAVARSSDQLVIMSYDTAIPYPLVYSMYVFEKLTLLLRSFSEQKIVCKVLLGVPTYEDAPAHKSEAENIRSALTGLQGALAHAKDARENFEGVAIYSYWTTGDEEWKDFAQYWSKGKQPLPLP